MSAKPPISDNLSTSGAGKSLDKHQRKNVSENNEAFSNEEARLVYVIDDDHEIRNSLTFLMATRGIAVATFDGGKSFLEALDHLQAAPILLDLRMPGMDGIEFLQILAEREIAWPVLVLSGHGEIGAAVKSIKLGAIDFLEKPIAADELVKCLIQAFKTFDEGQISNNSRVALLKTLSSLTPRESEVLTALCEGQANKQVAFALSISSRTVEMHRANALRRLGVRTIAEVVNLINATKTP